MSEDKENNQDAVQDKEAFDPVEFTDKDPLALDEPEDEIRALEAERDELKDRLMRALADGENIRKRGERDRRDAEVYGGSKLARDLLSVYDNLKRALETVDDAQRESSKALIEGIELTLRQLIKTFSTHKIEILSPEVGEKFNPQLHQAMFEAPVPNVENGHIIQLMTEGFTIADRLLRPAQVGVSSTPAGKTKSKLDVEV